MKHYVFVGSAGAYEASSVEPMHVEGDKRKPSAGGYLMWACWCAVLSPCVWRATRKAACWHAKRGDGQSFLQCCRGATCQETHLRRGLLCIACQQPQKAYACGLRLFMPADGSTHAGHVEVEEYLVRQDLPYTVFQPLYIYGPHTAKDCEQCEWTAAALGAGKMPLASSIARQFVATTLPGRAV